MASRELPRLYRAVVICLALIVALGGCHHSAPVGGQNAGSQTGSTSIQEVTGTVRHIDVEGGFYGIVTDDGKKLDPVNLPQEFQKDGLRIQARVEPLKDRVSIRMWGTPVRIIEFKRL
jgi:hypothetical protein